MMVTEDFQDTAIAVAREVGMIPSGGDVFIVKAQRQPLSPLAGPNHTLANPSTWTLPKTLLNPLL